ncbi:hypothetical protein [Maridesulfovibrio zosterae]|uniref:hypothetical protein n=1 Tax=Maridesulfovibrio zosterae TaxID=82171 RepID=UPI0003FBD499|nr:hypothetical protein [Maridesulfovibrio zosterae]
MKLNSIQVSILIKLSKDNGLDVDEYIKKFSLEFIEIQRDQLGELTQAEGDAWINKAYVLSLNDVDLGC